MTASKCKFRIALSLEQMQYIMGCEDCPPDLRKQLRVALIKADSGLMIPAYEVTPKQKADLPLETRYKLAISYLNRGAEIPEDLMPAYNEYRYLNDLMGDEESVAYSESQGF